MATKATKTSPKGKPRANRDWTANEEGVSNSSHQFIGLCWAVERMIRNSAHDLISGRADAVARLIVAKLAHEHEMRPDDPE